MSETGSTTGWGVGSSVHSSPTIQSYQTADFQAESKRAVSMGISAAIVPHFRSPATFAVSPAELSHRSLHPKIPFPATGLRPVPLDRPGVFGCFWNHNGPFEPGPYLSRIQPEGFELLAPFCRSITKSLYSNTAWQATFDRGAHEIWCEER
jgi:hypothetical protein